MQIDLKPARNQFNPTSCAQEHELVGVSASVSCAEEGFSGEKMNMISNDNRQRGFSMLELIIVLAMSLIVSVIGILGFQRVASYLRVAGDLRDLNGTVAQAKMSAAADFTRARAYVDLGANTFHLETWNKTANGGVGCWVTVGDPLALTANPCTVVGTSPVQSLSSGDAFGFGAVTTPPPNTQAAIAQAAICGGNNGAGTIANTACIVFNSRGIPIDAAGNPTGADAFYVTNGSNVFGITVRATGSALNWSISNSSSSLTWMSQ